MRSFAWVFLICIILTSCQPPKDRSGSTSSNSKVDVIIQPASEPTLGITPMIVKVYKDNAPTDVAAVKITGDKTHAGKIPVIRTAKKILTGQYRADTFEFTMAGDWVITAEIELMGGDKAQGTLKIAVPGSK